MEQKGWLVKEVEKQHNEGLGLQRWQEKHHAAPWTAGQCRALRQQVLLTEKQAALLPPPQAQAHPHTACIHSVWYHYKALDNKSKMERKINFEMHF